MNTSSVRKSIWVNSKEPKNKFDIWIKRQNNSYSLNVFDNGEWNLISGGNTPSSDSCINTVSGKQYEYTYGGTHYTSSGITLFHLPLFRSQSDSPDELFDAGTLGLAIKMFVSDEDWSQIVTGNSFLNILNIRQATQYTLGGVKALTDTISSATGLTSNYIASRFVEVLGSTNTDCYLYIKASDVVDKIGSSIIDEIHLATPSKIGGIKSNTHDSASENDIFVECKLNPSGDLNADMLSVNILDVVDATKNSDLYWNSTLHPENMSIANGNGTIVEFVSSGDNIIKKIDIQGLSTAPTGSVLSVGTGNSILYITLPELITYQNLNASSSTGVSCVVSAPLNKNTFLKGDGSFVNSFIGATSVASGLCGPVPAPTIADKDKFLKGNGTWASITGGTNYTTLSSGSSALLSYVVKGGGSATLYLNGNGQWATPINTQYNGGVGLNISGNTINIDISSGTAGLALIINNQEDNVEWSDIHTYTTLNSTSSGHLSGNQYVVQGGGTINLLLNGHGAWKGAATNGGIVIDNNGIYISGTNSTENRGKYLYLTSGGTEWREVNQGLTYSALNSYNYSTSGPFVISGNTGGDLYYLNGHGQWTKPTDTTYNVFSNGNAGLVPATSSGDNTKFLRGDATWVSISTGTTYSTLSSGSSSGTSYVVRGGGNKSKYLNGEGSWTEPVGTTYYGGVGINISANNEINLDLSGGSSGLVLQINSLGNNVQWITLSGSGVVYSAGDGIQISGSTISSNIQLSSSVDCSNDVCTINNGVLTTSGTSLSLRYSSYYNISNVRSLEIQSVLNSGNPIYFRVAQGTDARGIEISCSTDYIDSNGVFPSSGGTTTTLNGQYDCLVTIQFGIVRFEKITLN